MKRRDFLFTAGAMAAGAGCEIIGPSRLDAGIEGGSHNPHRAGVV